MSFWEEKEYKLQMLDNELCSVSVHLTPKTLDVDFPWQCQSLVTLCICSPVTSLEGEMQRITALIMSHMQTNLMQKEYFHFNCINVNQGESAGLSLGLLLQKDLYLLRKTFYALIWEAVFL